MQPLFTQGRVAASAGLFLDVLLGDERRKTGWMRAAAAGDPGPWRQQAILGRGRWDADALRDLVRDYVVETLAADDAVLVIDETGFLKQGRASCGVGRQYTGAPMQFSSGVDSWASRRLPAPRNRSRAASIRQDGSDYRRATGRRVRASTTGSIASWLISMPTNTMSRTQTQASGRAAC